MKLEQMQAVEVPAGADFRSQFALQEHVEKHVLEGRDERWHQVLDADLLSAARDEHARGKLGPCCRELGRAYERVLAETIHGACAGAHSHVHLARTFPGPDFPESGALEVRAQAVAAWSFEGRIFAVAAARVHDGRLGRYHIKTGYRLEPGSGWRTFARAIRSRIRHRRLEDSEVELVWHDEEVRDG
jgi:hypothetical protein